MAVNVNLIVGIKKRFNMRQRSKEELLRVIKTHESLQRDYVRPDEEKMSNNAAFWRASVEWVYCLWQEKNFNVIQLRNFLQTVVPNFGNITEEKRQEIRARMLILGCNWTWINTASKVKCKNTYDQSFLDLQFYNTELSVDFSLIACEYLLDKYKYNAVELDYICKSIYRLDLHTIAKVYNMRYEIYQAKGIWIQMNEADTEDLLEIGEDEEVEMVMI